MKKKNIFQTIFKTLDRQTISVNFTVYNIFNTIIFNNRINIHINKKK